jgi:hypothetical protein
MQQSTEPFPQAQRNRQQHRPYRWIQLSIQASAQLRRHGMIEEPTDLLGQGQVARAPGQAALELGPPPAQQPHDGGGIELVSQHLQQVRLRRQTSGLDRRDPGLQALATVAQLLQP